MTSLACGAGGGKVAGVIAVGYSNGCIRIFNYATADSTALVATLRGGHTSSVSCLRFSSTPASSAASDAKSGLQSGGLVLASGGADGNIVLWDCAADFKPIIRLRGHKNEVTGLAFLKVPVLREVTPAFAGVSGKELLVSVSKDTLLKVLHLIFFYSLRFVQPFHQYDGRFPLLHVLFRFGK